MGAASGISSLAKAVAVLLPLVLAAPVANAGLVALYRFDGDAQDSSGNGNHGTAVGTASTADRFGTPDSAFLFDGVSAHVQTPLNRADYDPDFSVAAWFRFDGAIADSYRAILGGQGTSGSQFPGPFFIGKDQHTSHIGVQNGEYLATAATGTPAWDGHWHHIAVTFSGAAPGGSLVMDAYLDGVDVGGGVFAAEAALRAASVIFIGHEPVDPTNFFLGAIDDVRIFDTHLSAAEVAALAAVPLPSTLILFSSALLGLGLARCRRRPEAY